MSIFLSISSFFGNVWEAANDLKSKLPGRMSVVVNLSLWVGGLCLLFDGFVPALAVECLIKSKNSQQTGKTGCTNS